MRIKRFNESIENDIISKLKNIIIEFSDDGAKTEVKGNSGIYIISITNFIKIPSFNFVDNLADCMTKIDSLGLNIIDKKTRIVFDKRGSLYNQVFLYYKGDIVDEEIKNYDDFSNYLENIIGLDLLEYDYDYNIVFKLIPGYLVNIITNDNNRFEIIGVDTNEKPDCSKELMEYIDDLEVSKYENMMNTDNKGIEIIKYIIDTYNKEK